MKHSITSFFQNLLRKLDLTILTGWLISARIQLKANNIVSLKSFIFLGFVIAIIPLFLGVFYIPFAMHETEGLTRTLNYQVFEQTKTIRLVFQKVSDIERKAKLFVLLSDPSLRQPYERQSYESARASFKQALNELLKLQVDNKIALLVNELSEKEDLIYQQIIGSENESYSNFPVDEAFQALRESSNTLLREFESQVDHKFDVLRQKSESMEQGLLIKGAILSSISLILIVILMSVVSSSMSQLDTAIRRLGSGDLVEPIFVTGSRDLCYLGSHLEWLRTYLIDLELSKQQLMHNVACEIEAPLESILEEVKLLLNEAHKEPNAAQLDRSLMLFANIERLKTMSEELIRYSQINSKPEMHHKETINMKSLLESVVDDFQTRLQAKSITLIKLVRPVEMAGVPIQLRNIIEQLLSNAFKFSPTNGEIRIMLRISGTQMELEVEDEGPGIDTYERSRVFEPFFRGKPPKYSDGREGYGLGLAIVREYVANHQGKVDIIDSRQGQHGTRIRVQIPLTREG
jgi:two-component system, NtrC family, sensor histidine kinase GlrK